MGLAPCVKYVKYNDNEAELQWNEPRRRI